MSPTISTPRSAGDRVRSTRRVRLALWWARLFARLAGSGVAPGVRQEIHAELAALQASNSRLQLKQGAIPARVVRRPK